MSHFGKLPLSTFTVLTALLAETGCSTQTADPADSPNTLDPIAKDDPVDQPIDKGDPTDQIDAAQARSQLERDLVPTSPDDANAKLAAGSVAFGRELYAAVAGAGENAIISPYSIRSALAMTYAGAAGTTASEMKDTLHFDLPDDELHAAFNAANLALMSSEGESKKFQLSVANALWGKIGREYQPTFLDTLATNYGAGLELLDFQKAPEDARITINAWVEDKTVGRVPELLSEGMVTSTTELVLTNAIYFETDWLKPFEAEATTQGDFTKPDGTTVKASLMNQTSTFSYAEGDTWQYISLPYADGSVSMQLLLPAEGSFDTVEAQYENGDLDAALAAASESRVDLTLPKWEFDNKLLLKSVLSSLGMPTAFSPEAQFDIVIDQDVMIDEVVHQANITVDESGTTAAAATAVIMLGSTAPPVDPPKVFAATRPFLFVISDAETGLILFQGRVADPSSRGG